MIEKILLERAGLIGVSLSQEAAEQFARYRAMVAEANRTMNLTRVSEAAEEAVGPGRAGRAGAAENSRLMDGVRTLADVGSGAGVPGVVLAIALPGVRVTLFDALKKRVDFLNRVCGALSLNARAVHLRSEDAARDGAFRDAFDCATARAVAPLPSLLELALPLVRPGAFCAPTRAGAFGGTPRGAARPRAFEGRAPDAGVPSDSRARLGPQASGRG